MIHIVLYQPEKPATPFPGCGYSIELQDDIPVSWGTIGICGGMGHPVRSKKND